MQFRRIEYHQVNSTFFFEIDDADIIEEFGSVERFGEIISHLDEGFNANPRGEEPTDEEYDTFHEFVNEYGYDDREDDWWTDRKGGYEVSFEEGHE